MDRKSITILAVAIGVYLLLNVVVDHYFPAKPAPIPPPTATNTEVAVINGPARVVTKGSPAPAASQTTNLAPEQILTVSNADLIWHFTSRGGGLKEVDLVHYPSVIPHPGLPRPDTNTLASLNHKAPLPVLALTGYGLEGDGDFTLTRDGDIIRAEKNLAEGLRVVKEFEIGTNYLFKASVRVENTSSQPVRLPDRDLIVGTAAAIGPLDDPTTIGTIWYNGVKSQSIQQKWFANPTFGCFPGTPRWHYEEGTSNVVWTSIQNQFFALAAMPSNPAPQIAIDKIYVPPPDLTGPTNSTSAFLTNGYQTSLNYAATVLAPHQKLEVAFLFYAGPKEYKRLSEIGQAMGNNLDLIMDFGVWGFFSKLLLLSMNGLHALGLAYGLTIIAITVIIKVVFWPLTNASTKSQKRMQALQPQLKAINEKYKDDAGKRNEKTMEFYKQNKVSPLGSCLPTLLQLPVFFGFYGMLRGAIELRGAHFLWAFDLSQADTIATIAGFPVNPLPLIMGATQLWMSHMMPPTPGMDPSQQKLMRWMPLMMIAFFYRMSAGLTLYWTVQNLLSVVQMKLTNANAPTVPLPGIVEYPAKQVGTSKKKK
jgi:YidC/Oxa1 family membrane protein insertase